MASVRDLAKKYSVDPQWLNNKLVEASIPVVANFSENDGYIDDEIANQIIETTEYAIGLALSYSELNEMKRDTIPFERGCYVYVLFENNVIVYIGQTTSLPYRISQHMENKVFTHVAAIKTSRHILELTETSYILKHTQTINIATPGIQSILKYAINKV